MANKFYDPTEQRAAKVNALFARIARRYDLLNDLQSFGLHRYWKRRVVELSCAGPGRKALDVCCGTGDLALAMARRGAEVVGLDFNEQMLQVAQSKVQSPPSKVGQPPDEPSSSPPISANSCNSCLPPPSCNSSLNPQSAIRNPQFLQADAQQLPFPDGSFDIVTVGYGLRNLADWRAGLREMWRVARPGGRVLVLDFGKPDNALWRTLYFTYLKLFVPVLGLLFCGNASAYAYILESLKHYPAQHGVAAHMRELGLTNERVIQFLGGLMTINYAEKAPEGPATLP